MSQNNTLGNCCGHAKAEHFDLDGQPCRCTRKDCGCSAYKPPGDADEIAAMEAIARQGSAADTRIISMDTAGAICDALGLPRTLFRMEVIIDTINCQAEKESTSKG